MTRVPRNILVLDEFPGLGGAEVVILQLLDAAARERETVRFAVCVPGPGTFRDRLTERGVAVMEIPELARKDRWMRRSFRRSVTGKLQAAVATFRPDIVVANSLWCLTLFRLVPAPRPPVVTAVHAAVSPRKPLKRILLKLFSRRLLRDAAGFVTVSPELSEALQALGAPRDTVTVIPNGIDPHRPVVNRTREAIREDYGIPPDALLVVAAGRLHPGKGQDTVVTAAKMVLREQPGFRFVIAGEEVVTPGENLGFTRQLRTMIAAAGLDKAVMLAGFVPRLRELLTAADIFVSASHAESFGLAVLEAMICGLPVVVSDVSGHRGLVDPGKSGELFPVDDAQCLGRTLLRLGTDPGLRREWGAESRRIARKYDVKITAARWLALLKKNIPDVRKAGEA